jgi:hypothetical protein
MISIWRKNIDKKKLVSLFINNKRFGVALIDCVNQFYPFQKQGGYGDNSDMRRFSCFYGRLQCEELLQILATTF